VGDARYSAIRALRAWLWLIAVVVALAGGVVGFVLAYDAASTRWQILAGIGAGVVGALLYATIFLVLIAFLSLALELAEALNWITRPSFSTMSMRSTRTRRRRATEKQRFSRPR
jgi:hypothetical protein